MLEILSVEAGSIADELGIQAGDSLVAVNGEPVNDLVDYLIEEPKESLHIALSRASGDVWSLDIEHDADEPLGLDLPHPEPKQCGNNCIFCFVHQLPRGMRRTLYVKDEDYRFSFLYGAYVTLTNLAEEDLQRILNKKLSPLYVSVHAADHLLRQKLLGNPAPDCWATPRLTLCRFCNSWWRVASRCIPRWWFARRLMMENTWLKPVESWLPLRLA